MKRYEKVTMTVDTRVGSVSYKIEDSDFGVAWTDQRFCSGNYYPGVSSSDFAEIELFSFEVE